jgi:large repetitive protein
MKEDFWDNLKDKEFDKIYHPDGKWIALTHFTLLEKIELGFIFYDTTPFYSLQLKITAGGAKGLEFEITYTKVTDTIGLFAAKFGLPDKLRTFTVGAASVTLPTLSLDIYTNGNWKADLGFPDGDDWSNCFRIEAQAGPVPVVGYGGFYVASLSSATAPDIFKGTYPSILSFGLAARLGVGKDFTAGPLKAGVSITFFGIIQGAVGYLTSGGFENIFSEPDALSLQGQFGLIGEIYGSIDFVIISASVNVRLEASVGIILKYEPHAPGGGDGSILLYVEASVSVSVTVSINCGLFTIHIGFSFDATFRFQWQLAGPSSDSSSQALFMAQARIAHGARLRVAEAQSLPLCPGLSPKLPLTFVPDFTVVFPASGPGVPWFATSLAVPYDNAPKPNPTYADFKPFEALATQLATFALVQALNLPAYNSTVWLESDPNSGRIGLRDIDQEPDLLTGWIDYDAILGQLALFNEATLAAPDLSQLGQLYATIFPMPPFLNLETKGRLSPTGSAEEFNYQFQSKNPVPPSYVQQIDTYFNQLFVNRTSPSSHVGMFEARAQDSGTPLVQEIFLDYFKGLIRATVHQLLVSLENLGDPSSPLDALFIKAVAGPQSGPPAPGRMGGVAGQMASIARGGVRLPTLGQSFTIPDGSPQPTTNPLYALLWQEFPVGGFAKPPSYTVTLTNPDGTQHWLTGSATFTITNDNTGVAPFTGINLSQLTVPGTPTPIPQTQVGPQSFPFRNAIVWTRAQTPSSLSLRPFPPNLARLQISEGEAISVLVKSRSTDGAYLPDGTLLNAGDVTFATMINLTVKQIPGSATGSFLKDVFALSGASQADEALLGRILAVLKPPSQERPVVAIQILYPTPNQQSGLTSAQVDPTKVFVLRTNTTTVSQPPPGALAAMLPSDLEGVAVAANLDLSGDGGYGFIQIIQQATVTNAPGR